MVIHGGAGTILRSRMTPVMEKAYIDTLTIALRTGYEILQRGGSSLDAVEAAIRCSGREDYGKDLQGLTNSELHRWSLIAAKLAA